MSEKLLVALFSFSALVPALLLHEIAHGAAALWCGDTTARDAGEVASASAWYMSPSL